MDDIKSMAAKFGGDRLWANHLSDEEAGKRVYEADWQTWNKYAYLVHWQDRHAISDRVKYLAVSIGAISLVFWLISRTFFYIATGRWWG